MTLHIEHHSIALRYARLKSLHFSISSKVLIFISNKVVLNKLMFKNKSLNLTVHISLMISIFDNYSPYFTYDIIFDNYSPYLKSDHKVSKSSRCSLGSVRHLSSSWCNHVFVSIRFSVHQNSISPFTI